MNSNIAGENAGESGPKKIGGDYAEKWSHIKYAYLILVDDHFIVFLDNDGDIDWERPQNTILRATKTRINTTSL
jgi:hypothetical protein